MEVWWGGCVCFGEWVGGWEGCGMVELVWKLGWVGMGGGVGVGVEVGVVGVGVVGGVGGCGVGGVGGEC